MHRKQLSALAVLTSLVIIALASTWAILSNSPPSPPPQIALSPIPPQLPTPPKKSTVPPKPRPVRITPKFDPAPLESELSDDSRRGLALQQISLMSLSQPAQIADALPTWLPTLMNAAAYDDVLTLTSISISTKPQSSLAIADQQRARVIALLHKSQFADALTAARQYYNIVPFADSTKAIDLLVDCLNESRAKSDPSISTRFKLQQLNSTDPAILNSIPIDPSQYSPALSQTADLPDPFDAALARGNLLLLSNDPTDALIAFQSAWLPAGRNQPRAQQILDSIARALRDQHGSVQPANAYLASLRSGAEIIPNADPATVKSAARSIPDAILPQTLAVPEIERQREDAELTLHDSPDDPQIQSGFECSTPGDVRKLSPTHYEFSITTQGFRDWFLFRITNVAHKTVRIDITGDYVDVADKWPRLNPVYAYATQISSPDLYTSTPNTDSPITSPNGATLPPTSGQQWHYIPNTWREGRRTLSFTMTFAQPDAFIAMRIPCTPTFNETFLRNLAAATPNAHLLQAGQSPQGRPLLLMQIGTPSPQSPCILIYAREHADEQDSSWPTLGAIEFLLSNDPQAKSLRDHFTFLIIPILDPDSAAASQHEVIMTTFLPGHTTPESIAWANWFKSWIDSGHRLDLVFDLHNVQSAESPQISCPIMEGVGPRAQASEKLHQSLAHLLATDGIQMSTHRWMRGLMPDRLGGWLTMTYGPITLAYELNAQASPRHMNLQDLNQIGRDLTLASSQFFPTPEGQSLLTAIDTLRQSRTDRWPTAALSTDPNAIHSESQHAAGVSPAHQLAAGQELIP